MALPDRATDARRLLFEPAMLLLTPPRAAARPFAALPLPCMLPPCPRPSRAPSCLGSPCRNWPPCAPHSSSTPPPALQPSSAPSKEPIACSPRMPAFVRVCRGDKREGPERASTGLIDVPRDEASPDASRPADRGDSIPRPEYAPIIAPAPPADIPPGYAPRSSPSCCQRPAPKPPRAPPPPVA